MSLFALQRYHNRNSTKYQRFSPLLPLAQANLARPWSAIPLMNVSESEIIRYYCCAASHSIRASSSVDGGTKYWQRDRNAANGFTTSWGNESETHLQRLVCAQCFQLSIHYAPDSAKPES